MSDNFILYQYARQSIKDTDNLKDFQKIVNGYNLSTFQKLGLIREWRAYWWLKGKYKSYYVLISDMLADQDGIDIIVVKDGIDINFCVSGIGDEEDHFNCDYKIIVTYNKIYQKRIERKVKHEQKIIF